MTDTNETKPDKNKKAALEPLDLWWMIQLYFVLSFIFCILEIYHGDAARGAVELIAAGLAYVGPANFIAAFRSRVRRKHSAVNLILLAVIAFITVAGAVWLMHWLDFHMDLFGVRVEGIHWVATGALVALIAGRKESD
jgi:hypothetical protein